MNEAMVGLQKAAQANVRLIVPRFRSTSGPWVRLGEHDIRVPADVVIGTAKNVAVLGYLDSSSQAGRIQILVSRPQGVREMIGLSPNQLRHLREAFLGR